jgi:hypothetical protein
MHAPRDSFKLVSQLKPVLGRICGVDGPVTKTWLGCRLSETAEAAVWSPQAGSSLLSFARSFIVRTND